MRVSSKGYVERRTTKGSGRSSNPADWRNWWLVKHKWVNLGQVCIPQHLLGKRVRFKMEIIEDAE